MRRARDCGYRSLKNLERAAQRNTEAIIAPAREYVDIAEHQAEQVSKGDGDRDKPRELLVAHLKKSRTEDFKADYRRRKAIVEPVFGNIKNKGIRILVRGTVNAPRAPYSSRDAMRDSKVAPEAAQLDVKKIEATSPADFACFIFRPNLFLIWRCGIML